MNRQLVGFGGDHYAPRFERVLNEAGWRVGHVAVDWQFKAMDTSGNNHDVFRWAFETSAADLTPIDGSRDNLAVAFRTEGFQVVSEMWIREIASAPLDHVAILEADVMTVEEELHFDTRIDAGNYEVVSLPDGLLDEAQGIDLNTVLFAVHETTVAFHMAEDGMRAMGRVMAAGDDYGELALRLRDVLREKHDSVVRSDEAITAVTRASDPTATRELGVPEGLAFGGLLIGQSVEADGEVVASEDMSKR